MFSQSCAAYAATRRVCGWWGCWGYQWRTALRAGGGTQPTASRGQGGTGKQGSRIEQWGTGGRGKSSGSMMCQVVSSSMMSSVCSIVQRAWARGGRWGEEAQQHQQRASVCPSGWVCGCQRCCSLDGPGAGAPLPLEGPRRGARSGPGSCLMDWPQCLPRTFSRFCSTASSVICCSSRERGRARRRGGASAALIVASSRQMP